MQTTAGRTHQIGQMVLDVHMDIFKRAPERKCSVGEFDFNSDEAVLDREAIILADDAAINQHLAVGNAAANVLLPEPPIKGQRVINLGHDLGRVAREAPSPHFAAHVLPSAPGCHSEV